MFWSCDTHDDVSLLALPFSSCPENTSEDNDWSDESATRCFIDGMAMFELAFLSGADTPPTVEVEHVKVVDGEEVKVDVGAEALDGGVVAMAARGARAQYQPRTADNLRLPWYTSGSTGTPEGSWWVSRGARAGTQAGPNRGGVRRTRTRTQQSRATALPFARYSHSAASGYGHTIRMYTRSYTKSS